MTETKEESIEEFKEKCKQVKKKQEEYFRLVSEGHCAVCLAELDIPKEMKDMFTTLTCKECGANGTAEIFSRGVLCGKELQEWQKKYRENKART